VKPPAFSYLRMSTDPQVKGDSRRRQLEASRAYADAHGLDLAESAELEDIGVSAFRGDNVREGSLGRFLEAVEAGRVKPGSYLIVESLDRLSRERILRAQSLFMRIILAGINLVTLADGRVYTAETADVSSLMYSLMILGRAHEESQTKSHRLSAAWHNKRAQAAGQKPMTKWCPAWLQLAPDRTGYIPIPERVKIVEEIFQNSASGVGIQKTATRLNEACVPTFNSPNGWHHTYVAKILANRAVLGEFQPHVRQNGRRVPKGEPIKGYFPAIVDEQLFYRAQLAKSQRKISGRGRKGSEYSNLFSGLAKCAYCRSPILFENKGAGPKGGTYLICDGAKRRLGCPSIRWRYKDFETSFLAFVEEIDIASIANPPSRGGDRARLEGELNALRGELEAVSGLMEKTYALLSEGGALDFIRGKLDEHARRKADLEAAIQMKTSERDELDSRETRHRQSKEEIAALIDRIQRAGGDDLYVLRAQVASQLKSLIETFTIASIGQAPQTRSRLDELRQIDGVGEDILAHIEQVAARSDESRRYFALGFGDGRIRVVFPRHDDPFRYEQQIVAGQSLFEGEGGSIDVLHSPDRARVI